LPFAVTEIDQHLPGGGLARGHLHEVIEGGPAGEHAAVATLFAAGIAARIPGPVLWCLRGRDLFAPALARIGLHPDRVIYCETWKDRDVLPAMEEGLRCCGIAAVVGEVTRLSLTSSRRLQLCAGETGVTALLLRRWRTSDEKRFAGEPNAAATRWRVSPSPPAQGPSDHIDRQRWLVELLRVKGGEPHSWIVEACDAEGNLRLPATLADRSAAAEESYRAAAG
jgi:protein ImuA